MRKEIDLMIKISL